jgi:aspartate/glutamate racemase
MKTIGLIGGMSWESSALYCTGMSMIVLNIKTHELSLFSKLSA